MKLSTKTRYCLQFLAEAARFYGVRTASLKEIARNQNLPLKYLSSSVIPLKTAGIISTLRGSTGGYTLARAPEKITLLEVYEALEGSLKILKFAEEETIPPREIDDSACWVWEGLSEVMAEYLRKLTLEDLKKELLSRETIDYHI